MDQTMDRPPLPPFNAETAAQKVRAAEDAWNTRDPARVAPAYTIDSCWRNRSETGSRAQTSGWVGHGSGPQVQRGRSR